MTVPRSVPTIFAAALLLFGADRILSQAEPEEVDTVTDEITVTAQRVEESVQDVPISIVTLSGEEIEQQAIRDVQGIADAAPGVVLGNQSSTTGEIAVTIRGIGSNTLGLGTESTVGYYVDGVYMPRPQSFASAFLDLERVEVLRGPQGTLWGRNSTGGALNLVTRSPEASFRGSVIGSLSDYDAPGGASDSRYGLSLTGPLTSKVLARISGVSASVEDATWNEHLQERADNLDGTTLRVGLTMLPTTGTTFTLRADQTDDDAHNNFQLRTGSFAAESLTGSLLPFFGHAEPIGPHRIAANIAPLSTYEESGLSLHIDHQTAGGLTLTSISSTRSLDSDRIADVDASPLDFVENHGTYGSDWWSQEVQLRGASDRTRWIAGAYFFGEEGQSTTDTRTDPALFGMWLFANNPAIFLFDPTTKCSLGIFAPTYLCGPVYYGAIAPFLGLPLPGTVSSGNIFDTVLDASSWAGYGQIDRQLGERGTLTLGLRYTTDEKDHSQTTIDFATLQPMTDSLSDSWNALTPKLGLEYRLRDNAMLYGALTTGYKSGGFNSISLQPSFNEETITSLEVGVKSRLGDAVTLNASAFSYAYDDLQVAVLYPDRSQVENAAEATIRGLDLELRVRPNPSFAFNLSLELLDDEFDEFVSQDPRAVAEQLYEIIGSGNLDLFAALGISAYRVPQTSLAGTGLPKAPDFSATASLLYNFDLGTAGNLTARGEFQHTDDVAFDAYGHFVQPAYSQIHAFLRWSPPSGSWFVNLYGRNLGNEEYKVTEFFANYTGSLAVWAPPAETGIQVGLNF